MRPASVLALVAAFGSALSLAADPPARDRSPRLTTLSPPGVPVGGRETWTFGGENLGRVDRIEIEGDGVSAVIKATQPTSLIADVLAKPGATPGLRAVRVEGPDGISNLRVIRVDHLLQAPEHEPNDTPGQATPLTPGSAGVGELSPQDVDHFRVEGKKGERVTIELEVRRLGLAIAPVVTVMSGDGHPLFQGRETPGVEGDCRFLYTFPEDAGFVIQVRDNLFGGSGRGSYRLRVTAEPFATGLFPLGGPPGRPLTVSASGGNLSAPLSQTVELPDRPGAVVEVPPFEQGQDRVISPARLVVGDGPEGFEAADGVTTLSAGVTVNGRVDRPGEVDRFRVTVKAGQTVHFRVVAAELGSWLDAVVTLRDSRGKRLAENDDNPGDRSDPDSRLEYRAIADDDLTVELTDRFGQGGPEYGYRLSAGPGRPDFAVRARILRPLNADAVPDTGAYSLKPGGIVSVLCEVVPDGRTGPITLRAEGLPEGVRSPPVVVRPQPYRTSGEARPVVARGFWYSGRNRDRRGRPGAGVKASEALEDGRILERLATDDVRIDPGSVAAPERPVVRRITEFSVRVLDP